ncbi:MAG TPA: hypothetical protein VF092_31695 [Longimicrobium sp.]
MRRSLAILAAAPLLTATTCFRSYELKTSPRPDPGKPAITGWSGTRPVATSALTVERCRPLELRHEVWSIARKDRSDSTAAPEPIIYGELPKGFEEERAPEPLAAGVCYHMRGYGTVADSTREFAVGSGGFHVLRDGTVAPGGGGWRESVHYDRDFERAAVHCRRAFRGARTPEQAAAVDARTFAISDTSITCEDMRTRFVTAMRDTPSTEKTVFAVVGLVAALGAIFWLEDVAKRSVPF